MSGLLRNNPERTLSKMPAPELTSVCVVWFCFPFPPWKRESVSAEPAVPHEWSVRLAVMTATAIRVFFMLLFDVAKIENDFEV